MKRIITLALVLFLLGTHLVSAHVANSTCQSITLSNAPQNTTAVIIPSNITVPGNGTFSVPAGVYRITWSDGYIINGIVVASCPISPSTFPTLKIIKNVINNNGGVATSANFTIHLKISGADIVGSPAPGVGAAGILYQLTPGAYTVSEDASPGYTSLISGDCGTNGVVILAAGDSKTCVVTNDDIASPVVPPTSATLHVVKLVINGNGSVSIPSNFNIHVKNGGVDVTGSPLPGVGALGTLYTLSPGNYVVSEDLNVAFAQTFSVGGCSSTGNVTLLAGDNKICTMINTNIPPPGPVVPGATGSGALVIVPLIGILKVPTPLSLPAGSGTVTYDYTVWNVAGQQALVDVTVVDDKCSPLSFVSGDLNSDGKLDINEIWKYTCSTIVSNTTSGTAIATGFGSGNQITIASAIATVVVGVPGFPNTGLVAPLINIVKVPSRLTPFPFGGGDVMYTYSATNPGIVSMHDVFVTDDKCGPVSRSSGDTNNNNLLDPGETWIYNCQVNVPVSTRNVATAEGRANGFVALGYAFATVLVSAPGFPNTGFSPFVNSIPLPVVVLSSILIISILLYITQRKNIV